MAKKYPSPLKAFIEAVFVLSAILVAAFSYYGSSSLLDAHPVMILAIFCGAILLWYRSNDS